MTVIWSRETAVGWRGRDRRVISVEIDEAGRVTFNVETFGPKGGARGLSFDLSHDELWDILQGIAHEERGRLEERRSDHGQR